MTARDHAKTASRLLRNRGDATRYGLRPPRPETVDLARVHALTAIALAVVEREGREDIAALALGGTE